MYVVMAYIAMAYTAMAYIAMAYIVMVYIVMAYRVTANIGMAYIVMAYIVTANIVMAYIVMAPYNNGPEASVQPPSSLKNRHEQAAAKYAWVESAFLLPARRSHPSVAAIASASAPVPAPVSALATARLPLLGTFLRAAPPFLCARLRRLCAGNIRMP